MSVRDKVLRDISTVAPVVAFGNRLAGLATPPFLPGKSMDVSPGLQRLAEATVPTSDYPTCPNSTVVRLGKTEPDHRATPPPEALKQPDAPNTREGT